MRSTIKLLNDGSRFRLPIRGSAVAETPGGPAEIRVGGEAIVVVRGDGSARRRLVLERLSLAATSIKTRDGETGTLTILGEGAEGQYQLGARADAWSLSGPCRVHDPRSDRGRGDDRDRGCYYLPTFLPASVRLSGRVSEVREGLLSGTTNLTVACVAGETEPFSSLVFEAKVPWETLVPLGGGAGNHPCPTGHTVNQRRLVVQPVGFRTGPSDGSPSGSTANAQLATAQAVWSKCCVEIQVQPIEIVTNATLKTSSDLTAIRAAFTDPDPNVIEIFFVQNPLVATGGGNAGAIGVASQKVVIAEPNGGNPVLLAHELGHALGLLHPPSSDWGTVLEPTGSAMNPGTQLVTFEMCQAISQPALQTLVATCCVHPDTGDHYIRDFPEDVGNEPSDPLPPGRTRYSMSNVWNRLSDTVGTFGANGPDHQHPARFEANGVTPKTNYLWARVEQTGTLPIHDGAVTFYMKHPGSGAGALTNLGTASVPAGSLPRDVRITWQVPAGTPNHSCVFAVVHSPAAPENPTAGLDWAAFEALSRADNDWAQRNLDIRNVAPAGGGNVFAAPPWVLRLDRGVGLPAEVHLAIDARQAKGLGGLVLDVGGESFEIAAGDTAEVAFHARRHDVPVALRGEVPGRARPGSRYTVAVDPRVQDLALAGYATTFAVTPPREYVAQGVDTLLAACVDLAALADRTAACHVATAVRREPCRTTGAMAALARDLYEPLEVLVEELGASPETAAASKDFGLLAALDRLRERLAAGDDPVDELEGLFDLAQRLQLVAWTLARA